MYRIQIDRSLCSGFGACAELAPDIIELDSSGNATARVGDLRRPGRARCGRGLPDGRDPDHRGGSGMTSPRSILVVGAGLAGARCAETLRAEGYDGELVLVGEEPFAPYERPALSKEFLSGEQERLRPVPAARLVLGGAADRARSRPARRRGRS